MSYLLVNPLTADNSLVLPEDAEKHDMTFTVKGMLTRVNGSTDIMRYQAVFWQMKWASESHSKVRACIFDIVRC